MMEQEQRSESEPMPFTGPLFTVVDIPESATAEQTAELLNGQFDQGVYVAAVVPWAAPGVGARVFMRRYAYPKARVADAGNALTKEARAVQFLRDNREMTAKQLCAAFKALGVTRSEQWINKKRAEIIKAERRVA